MRKILEDLWSFFALSMALIGIGGLAFHMFKNDGWASQISGRIFDAEISHPATAIPVSLAAIALAWACLNGRLVVGKKNSRLGDLLVFVLVFTGIYYIYGWLSTTL